MDLEFAPLITIDEAAVILRVKKARAYELARQGVLPVVRLGRQVRVDPRRLHAFLHAGGAAEIPTTTREAA
jgi:excisionase family DNA binding protein